MPFIPTDQIKQPSLHADTLGYTFVWNGHFLRGIYPSSVELAQSYFESGFIDDVVSRNLFPKTWISDFQNEQFGMILEHEMISPILYAMEWNYSMLKDAALMILEIAQIAWKYGYNMADCHKLNVLFYNCKPIYVDLGSFIPQQPGETGWKPYGSFLSSYFNILDVWKDGASQIAKRMMAPSLTFDEMNYWIYKKQFYRLFPVVLKKKILLNEYLIHTAAFGYQRFNEELDTMGMKPYKRKIALFLKRLIDRLKILPSQNLDLIKRKILQFKTPCTISNIHKDNTCTILKDILDEIKLDITTATLIDCCNPYLNQQLELGTSIKKIISNCQNSLLSNSEYNVMKKININLTCAEFPLVNNSTVMVGKFPEERLSSDIVILPNYSIPQGPFGIHNALVFIRRCQRYSKSKKVIVRIKGCSSDDIKQLLSNRGVVRTHCDFFIFDYNS